MYHRVANIGFDPWSLCVTPEHFAEHLEVLRRFHRVRLDQMSPGSFPGKRVSVAITFDDGYADNLYDAKRLLARFDTPATFFITTGAIGGDREFWWDELERLIYNPSASPAFFETPEESPEQAHLRWYTLLQPMPYEARRQQLDRMFKHSSQTTEARATHRVLTSEELRRLAADDLIEIGAHTVTHPLLAAQPLKSQFDELRQSKQWLEENLDRRITSFSYPYGGRQHYSEDTVEAVRRSGFVRACTTEPLPPTHRASRYEWGRINVTDLDGDQFHELLSAAIA
jgi:peptidoglycan/xylan/chitin deacetylase (PgdA/CDA1 family)